MRGIGGVPRNCGMEGIHGIDSRKQPEKVEESVVKQQNKQPTTLQNEILGNKIDL